MSNLSPASISSIQEVFDAAKKTDEYYFCRGICCDSCEDKPCKEEKPMSDLTNEYSIGSPEDECFHCGSCGEEIMPGMLMCPRCEKIIDWDVI